MLRKRPRHSLIDMVSNIKLLLLTGVTICFIASCQWGKHTLPVLGPIEVEGTDTIYKSLPPFKFINQDGAFVTAETVKNKVFIADFFFVSCPTICPVMAKNIKKVYEKYSDDKRFAIISHSIDTRHDSVPVLKDYADRLDVSSDCWNFVTGDQEEIYDIGYEFLYGDDKCGPG